jgi:hypothetical protein
MYFKNIKTANEVIHSNMFRPPYGRITLAQANGIKRLLPKSKIIMWDVLSGDFDTELAPNECLENVISTTKPGSIIVFHDSAKAFVRLEFALPNFLKYCQQNGWNMKKLNF